MAYPYGCSVSTTVARSSSPPRADVASRNSKYALGACHSALQDGSFGALHLPFSSPHVFGSGLSAPLIWREQLQDGSFWIIRGTTGRDQLGGQLRTSALHLALCPSFARGIALVATGNPCPRIATNVRPTSVKSSCFGGTERVDQRRQLALAPLKRHDRSYKATARSHARAVSRSFNASH